ncbi:hypothetical protein AVEN_221903-1 [Araneus ventricosus]|uniref:Uncharacterized protein n=1 Tax=Araneus ventricosus TaxID=182803 RepID=A0A4Y2L0A4_ARAVE|nr:hypothetical protein AVEN_221903-1 [Araneus ventricosus]
MPKRPEAPHLPSADAAHLPRNGFSLGTAKKCRLRVVISPELESQLQTFAKRQKSSNMYAIHSVADVCQLVVTHLDICCKVFDNKDSFPFIIRQYRSPFSQRRRSRHVICFPTPHCI